MGDRLRYYALSEKAEGLYERAQGLTHDRQMRKLVWDFPKLGFCVASWLYSQRSGKFHHALYGVAASMVYTFSTRSTRRTITSELVQAMSASNQLGSSLDQLESYRTTGYTTGLDSAEAILSSYK